MSGAPRPPGLIATHYRIDPASRGPLQVGGASAYRVLDERSMGRALLAVRTEPSAPPRARFLPGRPGIAIPNAVMPVDCGPGLDHAGSHGWFIICDALPGLAVNTEKRAWQEQELITCVLKPVAAALEVLQTAGLTHRAIRPDNLFRASNGVPVTLGPCWAAPPAAHQPSVCEPPYAAWCRPAGRGDGTVADDVYALGVTILALCLGRLPLTGLDEARVLRRKLDIGSFAALTEGVKLSPLIADLLRVMLAEDPEHRPSPGLLLNPVQACARRVSARPPRRAQLPLEIGGVEVFSARELAYAIGTNAERGCSLLKNGTVDRWMRRFLGDAQTASRLEEIVNPRGGDPTGPEARDQASMVMRAVAVLDPFAPLVWRSLVILPDGLPGAIAGALDEHASALEEIIAQETVFQHAALSLRRTDHAMLRLETREWRAWLASPGIAGGLARVAYGLNPVLVCQSPLLTDGAAARLAELLPALEAASSRADRKRAPMDPHIAAFVTARADPSLAADLAKLPNFGDAAGRLAVLRLFGRLQARHHPAALPGLAKWLLDSGFASLEHWRSRRTRESLSHRLLHAVEDGDIQAMLAVVEDTGAQAEDAAAATRATERMAWLETTLARLDGEVASHGEQARRMGREIATAMGVIATLGAVIRLGLG